MIAMEHLDISLLSEEFSSADLGDVRLTRRLMTVADAAAANPSGSFPQRAESDAELEGFYRFLRNPGVVPEAVMDAHIERTVERARQFPKVLVLHDTTQFAFGGEVMREGLGRLSYEGTQGFLGHFSICVAPDGEPLGTLGLHAWMRRGKGKGKRSQQEAKYSPDNESHRWFDSSVRVKERLHGATESIHVMDREGDCFELFSQLLEHDIRFTIRLSHNRRLTNGRKKNEENLFEKLSSAPLFFDREVPLSPRGKKKRSGKLKKFPARRHRNAQLEVRAQPLEIFVGNGTLCNGPASLTLNFVEVREVSVPEEEEPVIWRLVTTESIESVQDVEAVVDVYLKRWIIEEFFKALKTGCNYERRQLGSSQTLLVDLSIECAVAWQLLLLRWHAQNNPDAPARKVISNPELKVLKASLKKRKRPLPDEPTAIDVLYAVAALGGHIKNNGPPGWLVLRRGYEKLYTLVDGWLLAESMKNEM